MNFLSLFSFAAALVSDTGIDLISAPISGADLVPASVGDIPASLTDLSPTDLGPVGCLDGGGWVIWVVYAVIIGVFYFAMIRPQSKRRKKEEAMRKSVEIGDEITTIGGICGRVVSLKEDDTLVIETGADRAKIKIKAWAVGSNDTIKDTTPVEDEKGGFFSRLFKK